MRSVFWCACAASFTAFGPLSCLVLKSQHDELAAEVRKLQEQDEAVQERVKTANELITELQAKLDEAEQLLRRNQADLGLRVENLESETQTLNGAVDNANFTATALGQSVQELRGEMDGRVNALEAKLNEATNIPESKTELWSLAEQKLQQKDYKQARKLFRTYQSRYPEDAKLPDAIFRIGLTYFNERDNKSALGEFYAVVQTYPKSTALFDALYYSGLAFAKLGQCKDAVAYFEVLQKPQTKAPDGHKQKAGEQIQMLKKDNGTLCTQQRVDAKAPVPAKK